MIGYPPQQLAHGTAVRGKERPLPRKGPGFHHEKAVVQQLN